MLDRQKQEYASYIWVEWAKIHDKPKEKSFSRDHKCLRQILHDGKLCIHIWLTGQRGASTWGNEFN